VGWFSRRGTLKFFWLYELRFTVGARKKKCILMPFKRIGFMKKILPIFCEYGGVQAHMGSAFFIVLGFFFGERCVKKAWGK
jgi:hypothetical protein